MSVPSLRWEKDMRTRNHQCRSVVFREDWGQVARVGRIVPLVFAFLIGTAARADPIQDAEIAEADACHFSGVCNNGQGRSAPAVPSYDPCFIAQNAMRPCTKAQQQPAKPVGVDPKTVGTWKLPLKGGDWVWEIHRDGTYRFHSEAGDGAPSHAGTFSASNGHWVLKATSGYADSGTYVFQAPDTLIATGQLGTAAWRQPALKTASSKVAQ
jgi:hypothetical protein